MRLPGFTAEAAIGAARGFYTQHQRPQGSGANAVTAQAFWTPTMGGTNFTCDSDSGMCTCQGTPYSKDCLRLTRSGQCRGGLTCTSGFCVCTWDL